MYLFMYTGKTRDRPKLWGSQQCSPVHLPTKLLQGKEFLIMGFLRCCSMHKTGAESPYCLPWDWAGQVAKYHSKWRDLLPSPSRVPGRQLWMGLKEMKGHELLNNASCQWLHEKGQWQGIERKCMTHLYFMQQDQVAWVWTKSLLCLNIVRCWIFEAEKNKGYAKILIKKEVEDRAKALLAVNKSP
jgi:hypothetical protein